MSVFSDQLHQSGKDHSLYLCNIYFPFNQHLTHAFYFFGKPNGTTRFMKMVVWIKPFKTVPRFVFHQHCVSRDPLLLRFKDTWAVFGCALSLVATEFVNHFRNKYPSLSTGPWLMFYFFTSSFIQFPTLLVFNYALNYWVNWCALKLW